MLIRWTQQSFEELQQTAWIAALELESQRGAPVELENASDRSELLRRIKRICNRYQRSGRSRISLDQSWMGADGEDTRPLLESIRAIECSDPLEALLRDEDETQRRLRLKCICEESYSQFSAYVILLSKFDLVKEGLAAHLAILPSTLDRRIHRAFAWTSVQPSLFDRISRSSLDHLPPQRFKWPRVSRSRPENADAPPDLFAEMTAGSVF